MYVVARGGSENLLEKALVDFACHPCSGSIHSPGTLRVAGSPRYHTRSVGIYEGEWDLRTWVESCEKEADGAGARGYW
jgi:hypothetical protein